MIKKLGTISLNGKTKNLTNRLINPDLLKQSYDNNEIALNHNGRQILKRFSIGQKAKIVKLIAGFSPNNQRLYIIFVNRYGKFNLYESIADTLFLIDTKTELIPQKIRKYIDLLG